MSHTFNFSSFENQSKSDFIREMHQSRENIEIVLQEVYFIKEMHQSCENIEIVLQEVCVQHRNVDSIKNELSQDRRHSECVNTAKVESPPKVLQRV
uniref:Uncharacterized protein n=1 Tax=Panagrolaimus sp. PS1159 TaxID=55785 RepID=A0AC35GHU1_9BILA